MITRILLLIVIIGLVILYIGLEQENKTLLLAGIGAVIFGVVGVGLSIRNKKGMGTLRRL
jgi:hypothetical protein